MHALVVDDLLDQHNVGEQMENVCHVLETICYHLAVKIISSRFGVQINTRVWIGRTRD